MNVRYAATTALFGVVILMSGCTTPPAPVETSPAFSTEEEAFAAAEATYRAYVDAVNERRAGGNPTKSPEDFLVGFALEDEIKSAARLSDQGWSIEGNNVVTEIKPITADDPYESVSMWVCVDVAQTTVRDANSIDITPANRVDRMPINVEFKRAGDSYRISRTSGAETPSC